MTLLQLLAFLYDHPELTLGFGFLFILVLLALKALLMDLINMIIQLAKERTKQLTLQVELEKMRQAKPKQAVTTGYDYEQGYQQQVMEQHS
jgi:hypothetical protein